LSRINVPDSAGELTSLAPHISYLDLRGPISSGGKMEGRRGNVIGEPKILGTRLAQGHPTFSYGYDFMMGFG